MIIQAKAEMTKRVYDLDQCCGAYLDVYTRPKLVCRFRFRYEFLAASSVCSRFRLYCIYLLGLFASTP